VRSIQAPRSVAITVQNDQAFTATPRMLAALAVRLARRRLLLSGAGRLPFAFWRAGRRPLPLIRLKPRAAAAVPVGLLTKNGPTSTEHKAAQQHRSAHCLKSIRHVHPVLKSCVLSSWPKAKKTRRGGTPTGVPAPSRIQSARNPGGISDRMVASRPVHRCTETTRRTLHRPYPRPPRARCAEGVIRPFAVGSQTPQLIRAAADPVRFGLPCLHSSIDSPALDRQTS
jgi:hypothetical protein